MPKNSEWFEHGFFQTYKFCHFVQTVAENPFSFMRTLLQELVDDDGILDFVKPWQKESALHKFSRFIIESQFASESTGEFLIELIPDEYPTRWAMPVDAALNRYDLVDPGTYFAAPSEELTSIEEQDAYYSYWLDLRQTAPYEKLLDQLTEEVFTVLFSNRTALEALNKFLAMEVSYCEPTEEFLEENEDPTLALFSGPGVLKRKSPPMWAKRAVFYRDKGRCTVCNIDLSPASSSLTTSHFDHIIPLAKGGLNDVTNMQLLCESHNLQKGAKRKSTSRYYHRWYR